MSDLRNRRYRNYVCWAEGAEKPHCFSSFNLDECECPYRCCGRTVKPIHPLCEDVKK